ncbi:MAG: hypothetical protein K1X87_02920 [Dehalococcoidia bacterium]|nr:hypothetical protein [Dehalococcoidia bacterium]HRC62676.1 hypothetical protein [Dehalococcoidia bacterium]
MSRSTLSLLVMAALLVIAVGAAALIASLRSGEDELPAGTPERTVQLYLKAVEDHDATEAFSYLAPSLSARCASFPREEITQRGSSSIRATLDEVRVDGDRATVRVGLSETFGNAPFGTSDPKQSLTFELQQIEGQWRFTEAPWPLYCAPKLSSAGGLGR